jgi:hypothetical protein
MPHPLRTPSRADRTTSHQTVRLGRGRHAVPGDEVCVMELASMLAEEPFSDHPRSVCPVLGALLRAYNDHIDDQRRQTLYPLASLVVGTRAGTEVEERRTRALLDWCAARVAERPFWKRRLRPIPLELPSKSFYLHASTVIRCLPRRVDDEAHAAVAALVSSLAAIGAEECTGASARERSREAPPTPAGLMRRRGGGDRRGGPAGPDMPSRPPARAASRFGASTPGTR